MTTPRMMIVNYVYEAAKDAGEPVLTAACRRLRTADLRGWRRHADPADYRLVVEAYDALRNDAAREAAE